VGQTRQRCWRYDWILDLDQQWRSFHHLAAHGAQTFGGQTSEVKQTLRERMHEKVPRVGKWLGRILEGYYQYHAVPGNLKGLSYFRERVSRYWWASARKAQLTEAASTIWFRC